MAAILLSDCSVKKAHEGEVEVFYIVTPSTADSADTIDVSSLIGGRGIMAVSGWDRADGDVPTVTESASVLTLDAAGGATDSVYVIKLELAY